jgi:hypothetical protein
VNIREAEDWLEGNRSMCNVIPSSDFETWQVRVAQADAAMVQQAYYIVKAHREKELAARSTK